MLRRNLLAVVFYSVCCASLWYTVASTVTDGSVTTASDACGAVCELCCVHSSLTVILLHRSFRSGQSDRTPKPAARVSSFLLLFLRKPKKLSWPALARGTFLFLRSSSREALASSPTVASSLLSMLMRCVSLVAVYIHSTFGTLSPPSLCERKMRSRVECEFSLSHFLTASFNVHVS